MTRNIRKPPTPPYASSNNLETVPAPKQVRIPIIYLKELGAIWDADKRMPTPESRRAWALARGLDPSKVNNWWYRKKTAAKKHGVHLPAESYELPVAPIPSLPELSPSPVPETLSPSNGFFYGSGLGLGFDLGYVKKEEPQPEFEVTLWSDDPGFGPNPISSCSSDANGSLESDDNRYAPYIPTEASLFTPDTREAYMPSAYIQSIGDIGYLLDASYGQFSFDGSAALLQPVSGSPSVAPLSMSVKSPLLCSRLIQSIASIACRCVNIARPKRPKRI